MLTAEYKAKKILEKAESKKAEIEDYAEALTQAENGEFQLSIKLYQVRGWMSN